MLHQPCRDLKSRSRPRVVLQLKSLCRNLLKTKPGRDLKAKSRPRTQKNQVKCSAPLPCAPGALHVTTSKLGRDLVLEIGGSHSSFCLAQFFFFSYPRVAFLLLRRCSSLNTAIHPLQKFQEFNYNSFSCAKT